jgi:fructokinase
MSRPRAVVFGEAVIDEYPAARVVAGVPVHVGAHLARRGWQVLFVTRVGRDGDGKLIRSTLLRHGIHQDLVEEDDSLPTGRVTVEIDPVDNRFTVVAPAAWDAIEGPAKLPPHDAFCYGTIAGRAPKSRATLFRLLSASHARLRVLDVNLRPPDVVPEVCDHGLRAATVVKCNEHEIGRVAAIVGTEPEPAAYFDILPDLQYLCITRGPQGAELYERARKGVSMSAPSVAIADSVGAGDAFTAGLVDGLQRRSATRDVLRSAIDAAASVLRRRGGLPPG